MHTEPARFDLIARPWPEGAGEGWLARCITVPEGQVAVVVRDGVQVLSAPGSYRVVSAWEAFLGRPAPPIWLLPQGTITLHPVVTRLLSYDGQLIEADLLVLARLSDPRRFWQEQADSRRGLGRRDLERRLGRELQRVLGASVRRFPAQALLLGREAVQQVQREGASGLRALLQGWGMELQGIAHLGFRPARDAVAIEREVQAIRQAIADIHAQAAIERMDLEQMLDHARQEMQLDLTEADRAEVSTLAQEAGDPAAAWRQTLEARLERLEEAVQGELDALAAGSQEAPRLSALDDSTEERLSDLVAVLRVAAALVALATTAGAILFPHLIRDDTLWRLIGAGLGFLVAFLAFVSSWVVHRRLYRHRRERPQRLSQAQEAAERAAHKTREEGIRRYLEQRLRQINNNCQQAWERIYQHDIELASQVRIHCCQRYQRLADWVRQMGEQAAVQLQIPALSLDALIQLLAHTQGVLDQAQAMVHLSERLYQAAVDKDREAICQISQQLEKGSLEIENRFAERDKFMHAT